VPRIEMPPMNPDDAPVSPYAPTVTMETSPVSPQYAPARAAADEPEPQDDEIATITPRRIPKRSTMVPTLLIFLIPYAIFTTAFIGYLLYTWPRLDNPLKKLPDVSNKGQPRLQVRHDTDLDADMKVALGKSIKVGDIEVTPVQVKRTQHNDLVLVFRAKNVSANVIFNPISLDYLKYSSASMAAGKPYTFLERQGEKDMSRRIYGGDLEWLRGESGNEKPFHGEIGPGQEATIHLITEAKHRKAVLARFVGGADPLVWRIQVRRGWVPVDGELISATTVIGIEFSTRDIVKTSEET
jgi:hypothetical protein